MRTLGKTGARVSILAFGSGSRWLSYKDEDKALAVMSNAIDNGISYIDTAYGYGNGQSETWVGKLMPKRRNEVFLATKVNMRKADDAMRIIEGSLKRLNTDHVDLLHIHSLLQDDDLKAIEAPDGVLKVVYKMRDQKVARFIGITSHTDPQVMKTALERHDFDCTQMALNAARAGQAKGISGLGEKHPHSFESLALPVANRKKMGVIAMKVFAQEGLSGKAPVEKLIRYSMSLPVTAAVVGMPKPEYVEENIRIAKAFKPLPSSEMRQLSDELLGAHKASLDEFFNRHVDA
jgi:predicted aldo/keto reductase-like oxidoreductase